MLKHFISDSLLIHCKILLCGRIPCKIFCHSALAHFNDVFGVLKPRIYRPINGIINAFRRKQIQHKTGTVSRLLIIVFYRVCKSTGIADNR